MFLPLGRSVGWWPGGVAKIGGFCVWSPVWLVGWLVGLVGSHRFMSFWGLFCNAILGLFYTILGLFLIQHALSCVFCHWVGRLVGWLVGGLAGLPRLVGCVFGRLCGWLVGGFGWLAPTVLYNFGSFP